MNSNIHNYEYHIKLKPDYQINLSKVVIPFSEIAGSYKQRDIYSGNENIPFKERDSKFKMILRQEFANNLKSH